MKEGLHHDAAMLANRICGCATIKQHSEDVAAIMAFHATAVAEAKAEAAERAAAIAYRICAETRHVTLGDKIMQAILAEGSDQ